MSGAAAVLAGRFEWFALVVRGRASVGDCARAGMRDLLRVTRRPEKGGRSVRVSAAVSREDAVARIVQRRGLAAWVPMREVPVRVAATRQRAVVLRPVAPGYVFVGVVPGEAVPWGELLALEMVAGVVGAGGVPRMVAPAEMRAFAAGHDDGALRLPERPRVQVGSEGRVEGGAFEGWSGRVLELRGERVLMALGLFGGEVSVEVPAALVAAA